MIVNWIFLEMNAVNLAGNYSAVYDGWANGKAVYIILVVQNGWAISLTPLTVAIFFAAISTAINYAQGFNDRVLNGYQKRTGEAPEVSKAKRNRRGAVLTFVYICLIWVISRAGLTALVSKGLTAASYINLFTPILPTVMNVIIGWPDGAYDSGRKVRAGTEK